MRKTEQVTWSSVAEQVKALNPSFYRLVNEIPCAQDWPVIKATYGFGDIILDRGRYCLPNMAASSVTKPDLDYAHIPLSMPIENGVEVFLQDGGRAIPLNTFQPGGILGVFETANYFCQQPSFSSWSVSAGSRSVFMLPNITNQRGLNRLQNFYRFNAPPTKTFYDHWPLLKALVNAPGFTQPWQSTMLFFPSIWVEQNKDSAWQALKTYFLEVAWHQAQASINRSFISFYLRDCMSILQARRIQLNPYLVGQIKHLLLIAAGQMPGFRPVTSKSHDMTLPVQGIEAAFLKVYNLSDYPRLMAAVNLAVTSQKSPLYYSLSYPTLLEGAPEKCHSATKQKDLNKIYDVLGILRRETRSIENKFCPEATFTAFHTTGNHAIQSSKNIPAGDSVFCRDRFSKNSRFWQGCFRIESKPLV